MKAADAENPEGAGLQLFGRVTANLSHEINNVITIVGEASGLLEDYVLLAERGRPIAPEKLKSLSENIKRQVGRGKTIVRHMNFFGHSIDEPRTRIDVDLVAEHAAGLMARIAERKGIALSVKRSDGPVPATGNPFDLLQAAFLCVDLVLESPQGKGPILLSASADENGPCLSIRSAAFEPGESGKDILPRVRSLMAGMGGAASIVDESGFRVILLRLPPAAKTPADDR